MTLRKLITRPLPEPPAEMPGRFSLVEQALTMPQLVPIRLFWDNLRELRPWWPVLLPLMVWVGVRTYRRERAAVQAGEE
jgi:hypothetical protein